MQSWVESHDSTHLKMWKNHHFFEKVIISSSAASCDLKSASKFKENKQLNN